MTTQLKKIASAARIVRRRKLASAIEEAMTDKDKRERLEYMLYGGALGGLGGVALGGGALPGAISAAGGSALGRLLHKLHYLENKIDNLQRNKRGNI